MRGREMRGREMRGREVTGRRGMVVLSSLLYEVFHTSRKCQCVH